MVALGGEVMTLGQKLKETRLQAGYTQAKLGELAGVDYKTIAGWEQERHEPRFFDLVSVASVLGLSLDYLAGKE